MSSVADSDSHSYIDDQADCDDRSHTHDREDEQEKDEENDGDDEDEENDEGGEGDENKQGDDDEQGGESEQSDEVEQWKNVEQEGDEHEENEEDEEGDGQEDGDDVRIHVHDTGDDEQGDNDEEGDEGIHVHVHVDRYLIMAVCASRHDSENVLISREALATLLRDNMILQRNEEVFAKKEARLNEVLKWMFHIQNALALGFLAMGFILWKKW